MNPAAKMFETEWAREGWPAQRLQCAASLLAFVAAATHLIAASEHFGQWWAYGAFFLAVAVGQAVLGVLVLSAPGRRALAVGIASSAGLIGIWAVSRTVGVPVGPEGGQVEPAGALDLIAAAAEGALSLLLWALLGLRPSSVSLGARHWSMAAGALTLVIGLAASAGAAPSGAHPHAADSRLPVHVDEMKTDSMEPSSTMDEMEHPVDGEFDHDEGQEYVPEPCNFGIGRPVPTSGAPAGSAGRIASSEWMNEGELRELHVYDVATDTDHLVLSSPRCGMNDPKFRTRDLLTFDAEDGLHQIDLRTGVTELLLDHTVSVAAHGWSPDGTTLVFVAGEGPDLMRYRVGEEAPRVIADLGGLIVGRCGGEFEEHDVEWNKDGSSIMVVLSAMGEGTLRIVSPDGADRIEPHVASAAEWSPDGTRVVSLTFASTGAEWHTLDIESGTRRRLKIHQAASSLRFDPTGTKLTYNYSDASDSSPTTYIYDLTTDTERVFAKSRVGAVWLDGSTVAVSRTKRCAGCMGGWEAEGGTESVEIDGGARRDLAALSTMWSAVWYVPSETQVPQTAPELAPIDDVVADAREEVRIRLSAFDTDGDALTFAARDLPRGATFDQRTFSWMPRVRQAGTYRVRFIVTDANGLTDEQIVTIRVRAPRERILEELRRSVEQHTRL